MQQGKRLKGKVAIVTGAASGIGAEIARVFGQEGAAVVLCDVQDDLGRAVAGEIVSSGGVATYARLDVCSEGEWTALVDSTERMHGKVDVLGNVAGISGRPSDGAGEPGSILGTSLAGQSLANWNRVMEVNATGVFLGTRSVIGAMQRAGGGSVVNMCSICGIVGSFANAAYHASKGAVRIFSKSAAIQYARDQIRVNSVHPGFVETPLARQGLSEGEGGSARLSATPLGRFGKPRDVAMGCLYLASDEAAWVTGTELVIDGGMTAA